MTGSGQIEGSATGPDDDEDEEEDDDEEEMNKMRRVTRRKRLKLNVPIAAQLILIPQDSDPGIRLDLLPI